MALEESAERRDRASLDHFHGEDIESDATWSIRMPPQAITEATQQRRDAGPDAITPGHKKRGSLVREPRVAQIHLPGRDPSAGDRPSVAAEILALRNSRSAACGSTLKGAARGHNRPRTRVARGLRIDLPNSEVYSRHGCSSLPLKHFSRSPALVQAAYHMSPSPSRGCLPLIRESYLVGFARWVKPTREHPRIGVSAYRGCAPFLWTWSGAVH